MTVEPDALDADFNKRMAAYAHQILARVVCTHAGRGFDGPPVVLVAYLDDRSVVPHYRYWREEVSEVGGRLQVIAQSRGSRRAPTRPGDPKIREVLTCACGIEVPLRGDAATRLAAMSKARGEQILELSALPRLIKAMRDTP